MMKALVLRDYMLLEHLEVPEPTIGPGQVLIRVRACGICGSDVHGMDGSTGRRQPPIIMGHEAAGEIAALGEGVSGWALGDRVTFDSTIFCGECSHCREGRVNLCNHRRVLGVSCGDYRQDGAFAEYVAVPARVLYRLPEGLNFEHAAMVEPVSIALHAVERSGIRAGESAIVFGAGMIGLLVVQALRMRGARATAVDIDPHKLKLARAMGAETALAPDAADMTSNADHCFEVVGITQTLDMALHAVRKGGTVTLVGNVSPRVDFALQAAVTKELNLMGSCASCGEYPAALKAIATGAIDVAPLISAGAPLNEGAEWFARLHAKEPGLMKVILRP